MKIEFAIMFSLIILEIEAQQYGEWNLVDSMNTPRNYFSTVVFSNNRIMASGGDELSPYNSTEIYDIGNNIWESTSPMLEARLIHHLISLKSGKVIAVGGYLLRSCEIFDPDSNTWRFTDSLETLKYFGSSVTLLNDGQVLEVGGFIFDQINIQSTFFNECEIFDPLNETWILTDSLEFGRYGHTATVLNDGRVLVTGGRGEFGDLSSCEIFDPVSNQWSPVSSLIHRRLDHSAVLLPDGRVLVSGGVNTDSSLGITNCEVYDPNTNLWSEAGQMIIPRWNHASFVLKDSNVLFVGGGIDPEYWELFDSESLTSIHYDTLPVQIYEPEVELLPDGRVMTIGGYTFDGIIIFKWSNQCLMYTPSLMTSDLEEKSFDRDYYLGQNYPNPFNPSTIITFSIPERSFVTLKIYDMLGREVAELVNEELETGSFEKTFEASSLASGVYIYRITAMKDGKILFNESKQMLLIK